MLGQSKAQILAMSWAVSLAVLAGCGLSKNPGADTGSPSRPGPSPSMESVDFETIESELFSEVFRLGQEGLAKVFDEIYAFAEAHRGLDRDEDREKFANVVLRKEKGIEYFVAYRETYLLALRDRRLANDQMRDAFADKVASEEHTIESAAIWIDAYRFAREIRRFKQDGIAYEFVRTIFHSKLPRVYWKEYRAAYLVALSRRQMQRDEFCDRFASEIAKLAVERSEGDAQK